MNHRRTVSRRAFVPPVWLVGLTVVAILGGLGWLGWYAVDLVRDNDTTSTSGTPSPSPSPSPEPSPTPEPTGAPTPGPTPEPTLEPTPAPVSRTAGVSVLNNTGIGGLAAQVAGRVQDAGWTDVRTGNWRGQISQNTVYYPPGLQDAAQTLAADLGISRVAPAVANMRADRLTVIVVERPSSSP